MPESPLTQVPARRPTISAISTPGLILACAAAMPQLATGWLSVSAGSDGVTTAPLAAPNGIVLVISEGILATPEDAPQAPALARLAASGVRFSDVVSPSPCAAVAWRALETSRWTRPGERVAGGARMAELFSAAGWAVDEIKDNDPEAVGAILADRLDAPDHLPFFALVTVPGGDSAQVRPEGADAYLAQVERVLAERRLAQTTLVIFTATHGIESPSGRVAACSTLSAAALTVPLVMRWPAAWPEGMVVERTVSLIDVMPTLFDAAQIATPTTADGQSLVPLLLAPEAPSSLGYQRRPVFAYLDGAVDRAVIVDGGWKLIRHRATDGELTYRLYDHVSDRDDSHDVAARYPDVTERLIRRLDQWLRDSSSEHGKDSRRLVLRSPVS